MRAKTLRSIQSTWPPVTSAWYSVLPCASRRPHSADTSKQRPFHARRPHKRSHGGFENRRTSIPQGPRSHGWEGQERLTTTKYSRCRFLHGAKAAAVRAQCLGSKREPIALSLCSMGLRRDPEGAKAATNGATTAIHGAKASIHGATAGTKQAKAGTR